MKAVVKRIVVLSLMCGSYVTISAHAITNQASCSYSISFVGYSYSCSVTCTNNNASCSYWGGCHC